MAHTLLIDDQLIAPLREAPAWGPGHGQLRLKVTSLFLGDPSILATGEVAVSDDHEQQRTPVKCFAYHGDAVVLYVDGCALESVDESAAVYEEDHLLVGHRPLERVAWVRRSADPAGPCVVACSYEAWNALGLRVKRAPRPCRRCPVGQLLSAPVEADPEQWIGDGPPALEVVRLRERRRLTLAPFAATFDEAGAELITRVVGETDLSGTAHGGERSAG